MEFLKKEVVSNSEKVQKKKLDKVISLRIDEETAKKIQELGFDRPSDFVRWAIRCKLRELAKLYLQSHGI